MSNKQTENMENSVPQIELATWAVLSEPLDDDAIARVKENAKRLASMPELDESKETPRVPNLLREQKVHSGRSYSWLIRGAVAAAIAGVICAIVLLPGNDASAFAAALKKLDLVKVFSFDHIVHAENLPSPGESRTIVCEDGRSRSEVAGTITLMDETGIARLTLIESTKTAIVLPAVKSMVKFDKLAWLKELKGLDNETSKDLGEKEIDGVRAIGKELVVGAFRLRVWVDAEAEELVLLEQFFPEDSPIEKAVMKNFDFDEKVDESLFSLEVPEGYAVHDPKAGVARYVSDPELNVTELLKDHAEICDGKFPVSLGDWSDWLEVLSNDGKPNMDLAQKLGALKPFLSSMRTENYGYLGDGVSLNQQERVIVFWYKNEEAKFRAIYSDLTAADISEADLPK